MPVPSSEQPLTRILENTQELWDTPEMRPAVRANFHKVLQCRTAKLGAEVYASEHEQKVVYHTCKSRSCSSCGRRATLTWQRELTSALLDIPYTDVVFTMPDKLWPILRENRHLLQDLPALGGLVMEQWAAETSGLRVFIMVIRHTAGRDLKFNPHLHMLVSSGGLDERALQWIPAIDFNKKALMVRWKSALIGYLREVLRAGSLISSQTDAELRRLLTEQGNRWWNVNISCYKSKKHFIGYAGCYLRRPPIARHRFRKIDRDEIHYVTKDLKLKREVHTVRKPKTLSALSQIGPGSLSSQRPLLRPSCSANQDPNPGSRLRVTRARASPAASTAQLGLRDRERLWAEPAGGRLRTKDAPDRSSASHMRGGLRDHSSKKFNRIRLKEPTTLSGLFQFLRSGVEQHTWKLPTRTLLRSASVNKPASLLNLEFP